MKKLLFMLIVIYTAALAQNGSISGFVFDAITSYRICHAYVTAQGPGFGSDTTCQMGGYQIPNLPPGYYLVTASAPGYQPGSICSVVVHPGQNTPNINFYLVPNTAQCGSISGFVYNANTSQPIYHAYVLAQGPSQGDDYTCQMGGYNIGQLLAGYYRVTASAPGYIPDYRCSVIVNAGQNTPNISFWLYPDTNVAPTGISGTVINTVNSNPIRNALVRATNAGGSGQANTNCQGGYLIQDINHGYYYVQASASGFHTAAYPDSVLVVNGQITPDIDFALVPLDTTGYGSITGHVTDSTNGSPIHNAQVCALGPNGQGHAFTYPCGFYKIQQLAAGNYRVRAAASGYYPKTYPDSVRVNAGQMTININFALASVDTGGIAGFVSNGATGFTISNAQVTASGPSGTIQVYTDNNGDYIVDDLEEGIYYLSITASGYEPLDYPDAILVQSGFVTPFICPVLYPATGIVEQRSSVSNMHLNIHPNPFSGQTTIKYAISDPGIRKEKLSLRVYDISGRVVRSFSLPQSYIPVIASVNWDGRDEFGKELACGVYFVRLETSNYQNIKSVVILR